MARWSHLDSETLYNVPKWGLGFFRINEQGNVEVKSDPDRSSTPANGGLAAASAAAGTGAFFNLKRVTRGTRIQVENAAGRTITYRVTSLREMVKAKLPLDIWSRRGKPRLVLVTCGGPFLPALGHYRDNIVVTATPV